MAKKFIWKLWLYPNLLTKDVENDYVAEVSTTGNTWRNEDIARRIVKERSELREETILSILHERDAIEREAVLGGSAVQSGNVRLAPRVKGNWTGTAHAFDPQAHKITVNATPTDELHAALEEVGVEVLGSKSDGGAFIGLVTDLLTGKTDGTISIYADLILDGEKIRIAPVGEAGLGAFFVAADGAEVQDPFPFVENNPKKVILRVPMLTPGTYTLKIVTRFSQSNALLKHPRTIVYGLPLTVVE